MTVKRLTYALILFALLASFQSQAYEFDNNQFENDFKAGLVELKCGNPVCGGRWGFNRRELKAYNNNSEWMELAKRTAELNTNKILAYYYLAKSALNLGYYDAALTYIENSKNNSVNRLCLLGSCEGIDVENELAGFKSRINQAKEAATKSKPAETLVTSMSPNAESSAQSYTGGGYIPEEIIYSGGGYTPEAATKTTSKTLGTGNKNEANKTKAVANNEGNSSDGLCKSYGLKKGTRDYAECMLRIREQDIAKDKNDKEAAVLQQKTLDEQKAIDDKRQAELQTAEDEQRKKQAAEESLRTKQIQLQQQQYTNAVRQCLMKAKMLYESTSDLVTAQIRNNNDQHLYFLMENMKHEASDKCRQNTGYADLMEKQIFSYTPQPATPAPNVAPSSNMHCQTRASGGQIYTDCY